MTRDVQAPPDVSPLTETPRVLTLVAEAAAYQALRRGQVVDGLVLVRADVLTELHAVLAALVTTASEVLD